MLIFSSRDFLRLGVAVWTAIALGTQQPSRDACALPLRLFFFFPLFFFYFFGGKLGRSCLTPRDDKKLALAGSNIVNKECIRLQKEREREREQEKNSRKIKNGRKTFLLMCKRQKMAHKGKEG